MGEPGVEGRTSGNDGEEVPSPWLHGGGRGLSVPSPLWGRVREGGATRGFYRWDTCDRWINKRDRLLGTPLPNPPPQGGRERTFFGASLSAQNDRRLMPRLGRVHGGAADDLAEFAGLVGEGLHLGLDVIAMQPHHVSEVLGVDQRLGVVQRGLHIVSAKAMARAPMSLAPARMEAPRSSIVPAAASALASSFSKASRACLKLHSAPYDSCGCNDAPACGFGHIKVIAALGRYRAGGAVDLPAVAGDTNPFLRLPFPASLAMSRYKPVG